MICGLGSANTGDKEWTATTAAAKNRRPAIDRNILRLKGGEGLRIKG